MRGRVERAKIVAERQGAAVVRAEAEVAIGQRGVACVDQRRCSVMKPPRLLLIFTSSSTVSVSPALLPRDRLHHAQELAVQPVAHELLAACRLRPGRSRSRGGPGCGRCRRSGCRRSRRGTSCSWPSIRCASRDSPGPTGWAIAASATGSAFFHRAKSNGPRFSGFTSTRAPASCPSSDRRLSAPYAGNLRHVEVDAVADLVGDALARPGTRSGRSSPGCAPWRGETTSGRRQFRRVAVVQKDVGVEARRSRRASCRCVARPSPSCPRPRRRR